jgi:hypothetical protein
MSISLIGWVVLLGFAFFPTASNSPAPSSFNDSVARNAIRPLFQHPLFPSKIKPFRRQVPDPKLFDGHLMSLSSYFSADSHSEISFDDGVFYVDAEYTIGTHGQQVFAVHSKTTSSILTLEVYDTDRRSLNVYYFKKKMSAALQVTLVF